jgi:hypothetical protein
MTKNDKLEAARRLLAELKESYRTLSLSHRQTVRDAILRNSQLVMRTARTG